MNAERERFELVDHRWHSTMSVTLRGVGSAEAARWVGPMLRDSLDLLERTASRFRVDSELSVANRSAGEWVEVSPLLVELVRIGLEAARTSDGLVDPCLGRAVDAAGYRTWAAAEVAIESRVIPAPTTGAPERTQPLLEAVPEAGTRPTEQANPAAWQRIELAEDRLRVPSGCELDLGATAKAWLADELAERIVESSGLDVVVNLGGDLRAVGVSAPWVVGIDHEVPGWPPQSIEITDGGLATSGQGHRRWLTSSGTAHHLIDPRTGRSAVTQWWAVSVLAATATGANIASTAAMVLDDRAVGWLRDRGLDAVLSAWTGQGQAVRVPVGRWPRIEEWVA